MSGTLPLSGSPLPGAPPPPSCPQCPPPSGPSASLPHLALTVPIWPLSAPTPIWSLAIPIWNSCPLTLSSCSPSNCHLALLPLLSPCHLPHLAPYHPILPHDPLPSGSHASTSIWPYPTPSNIITRGPLHPKRKFEFFHVSKFSCSFKSHLVWVQSHLTCSPPIENNIFHLAWENSQNSREATPFPSNQIFIFNVTIDGRALSLCSKKAESRSRRTCGSVYLYYHLTEHLAENQNIPGFFKNMN